MNIEVFLDRYCNVVGKSGDEVQVMCVFHDDGSKASMYVNTRRGLFMCHACGAKGSVKRLQKLFGSGLISRDMDLDKIRERLRAVQVAQNEEVRYYPDAWLGQFRVPTDYWTQQRGLSMEVQALFDLGYDPFTDAAIIPLRDSHGKVIGVVRRHMGNFQPRYLYPDGFKAARYLFAAWLIRSNRGTEVALTEGSIDAMALWDAGIPAVAMMGSRLSDIQVSLLREIGVKRVTVFTDNDNAGAHAAIQAAGVMKGFSLRFADYPRATVKDPADLTVDERVAAYEEAAPRHRVTLTPPA